MTRKHSSAHVEANDHTTGYESYDQRIGPVVKFAIVLVVGTVLVLGLMKLAAQALGREAQEGSRAIHPLAEGESNELPPEPRLQEAPALDLQVFRAREEERLSTYGWVDRQTGVVRIPIERAMAIVLREGLPARKGDGR